MTRDAWDHQVPWDHFNRTFKCAWTVYEMTRRGGGGGWACMPGAGLLTQGARAGQARGVGRGGRINLAINRKNINANRFCDSGVIYWDPNLELGWATKKTLKSLKFLENVCQIGDPIWCSRTFKLPTVL